MLSNVFTWKKLPLVDVAPDPHAPQKKHKEFLQKLISRKILQMYVKDMVAILTDWATKPEKVEKPEFSVEISMDGAGKLLNTCVVEGSRRFRIPIQRV